MMAAARRRKEGRTRWRTSQRSNAFAVLRHEDVADTLFPQDLRHRLQAGRLTVDHEGAPDRTAEPAHPGAQLAPVGVGRVAADRLHFGAAPVLLAEDLEDFLALLNPAAEGVLRLEADEEDQVSVVADAIGQMVKDAARLRHARRRDDDRGTTQIVERLRVARRRGCSGPAGSRRARRRSRSAARGRSKTSGCIRNTVVASTASGLST